MSKDPFKYFRIEARELVDGLAQGTLELEKGRGGPEVVVRLLRVAHTLKGASRVVKLGPLAEIAHAVEEVLAPHRDGRTPVTKEAVAALLRHVDGIRVKIRELDAAPVAAPAAVVPTVAVPAPVTDAFETVRVDLSEMESFLESVTEVATQGGALRTGVQRLQRGAALAQDLHRKLGRRGESVEVAAKRASAAEELRHELRSVHRVLSGEVERLEARIERIHESGHRMRLLPASTIFATLERAVLDAGQSVQRLVGFHAAGGDHRLDAQVLGALRDALLHVVRNAVAHGIESAAERAAAGKPAEGRIGLTVELRGRRIAFLCTDDGRGIDVDGVRAVAVRRGLVPPAEAARIGLQEAVQLLLKGGVTTTSGVTELSGRGVGLDVLRDTVTRLKGEVAVSSAPGKGTTIEVVVPITLSSQAVLMVEAQGTTVSIPLEAVAKSVLLKPDDVSRSANRETIRYEDRMIPLLGLAQSLGMPGESTREKSWPAVILRSGGDVLALRVDRVQGVGRAVVRPLPAAVLADPVVYGASLDPEGNARLALDPAGLAAAARTSNAPARPAARERRPILVIDDSLTTRMLEQSILESAGYTVDLASSGEEGLAKARERRYALFICDVEMPGMNGFEFVSRAKAEAALKDVPSILVTSLASAEDKSRGKRAGARAYIVKSEFDQGTFMQIIDGLIA